MIVNGPVYRTLVTGVVVAAVLAASAGVAAAAVTQDPVIETADRDLESGTVDPGETVAVTVSVELGDGAENVSDDANFAADELFDPDLENVTLAVDDGAVAYNGESVTPTTHAADTGGVIVALERADTPNGEFNAGDEVTLRYTVTVPENAGGGDEFAIDGDVRLGEESLEPVGPDSIAVSDSGSDDSDDDDSDDTDDSDESDEKGSDGNETDSSDDGEYLLSDLTPSEETIGEDDSEIAISIDVRNDGERAAQRELELVIETTDEDEVVFTDTVTVELAGDEARTITFEAVSGDDLEPGTYRYVVTSGDDERTGALTVESAADSEPGGGTDGDGDGIGFGPLVAIGILVLAAAILLGRRYRNGR